jgi:hypothetical protein
MKIVTADLEDEKEDLSCNFARKNKKSNIDLKSEKSNIDLKSEKGNIDLKSDKDSYSDKKYSNSNYKIDHSVK